MALTPSSQSSQRKHWFVLLLILGTAIVHAPTLFNPFFIDDYVYIETVQTMSWAKLGDIFTSSTMGEEAAGVWWTPKGMLPFYRPVGETTFWVDYQLSGLHPFGYHLTNLVLHLVATLLVYRLASRWIDDPRWPRVAAVIFALHPAHNEAVAWISGRFDLLVTVCALASILCYCNAVVRPRAGRWWLMSGFWFVLGLGCKETALILPAMIVLLELIRAKSTFLRDGVQFSKTRPRSLAWVIGMGVIWIIAAVYLVFRFWLFGGLGHLPPPYGIDWSDPLSGLVTVAWYALQYAMDFALFIQVDAFFIAPFWKAHPLLLSICALAVLVLLAAVVRFGFRFRLLWIGLGWTALFMAPALLAMPGERNIYLAGVGVALMLTTGLAGLFEGLAQRSIAIAAFRRATLGIVVFWVVLTQFEWAIMWCVAGAGEKVFQDIEALVPEPPADARIYVVNQCPLSAVGFDQALRLRYGRSDIKGCALTLAPTFVATTEDEAVRTGPRSVRIVRQGGAFFQSPIEQFHLFSGPVEDFPESCRRWDLELLSLPTSLASLTELNFEFPYRLDDDRLLLLRWDNSMIKSHFDYPKLATEAAVERVQFDAEHVAGRGDRSKVRRSEG